jgi:D-alanyl-D-alanine endopeptidase (penicillin-binding protein 7)
MTDVFIEPIEYDSSILVNSSLGMGIEPFITASSAIVMLDDGSVLWQKKSTSSRPLASLTKLVAVKTFFETKPSLNVDIVYSEQDEKYNYEHVNKWESARLRVSAGDILSVEDLIYASLVGSANNTIESLVRASGLNRTDFIDKMNQLVKSWGASSTHFIEPSGLAPQNVSSALDYGIISRECLKHPLIAKVSATEQYKIVTKNTNKTFNLKNTNNLIRQHKYNVIGSKTGYLNEAGYCLMMKIENGEKDFYVVTMGVENRDLSYTETANLIEFAKRKLIQ